MSVLLLLACSPSESETDAARARASAPPRAESAATAARTPWYDRTRALDLTGDGQADRVRLRAEGERADSLRITLVLLVGGEEKLREEWGSGYELALTDARSGDPAGADSVLRAELDSVLASVTARPLEAPGRRLMAEDSAILAELEPRPTHVVSFSYGYESTTRAAWDAARRRFVRLWSCC